MSKAPLKSSVEQIRARMDEARERQTVIHLRKLDPPKSDKFIIGLISILIPLSMGGLMYAMVFG